MLLSFLSSLARERGLAVFIVLHDLNIASTFSDRIVLLANGEVVVQGTPAMAATVRGVPCKPVGEANTGRRVRWEEPTPIQRIAAQRTTDTFTSTPHFYLTSEVSAEALAEMRERLLPAVQRRAGVRLTFTDLLVKIAAATLAEHPRANAFWRDGRIGVHEQIDIGIATSSERGLWVPVLRDADRLSLVETARERARLVDAARSGKLSLADVASGTFTLSNLGSHRVDQFQPVLNTSPTGWPDGSPDGSPDGAQSVILAAGRIASRPFVINGQLAVARTIFLTIACDHRVLDGALAAAFLDRLIELIEEPYELLV
jgi:pyruvate dehydrogenase E2 component (dihydrolipoamide acetyltransferase)